MPQGGGEQFDLINAIDQLLVHADELEQLHQKFQISTNDKKIRLLAEEHRQIYNAFVGRDFSDPSSSSYVSASRLIQTLIVNSDRTELFALKRNIEPKLDKLSKLVSSSAQRNDFGILNEEYRQLKDATRTRTKMVALLEKVDSLLEQIQQQDSIALIRERIDQLKSLSQELENSSSKKLKKLSKECHNLFQLLQSKFENDPLLDVTNFIPIVDSYIGSIKSNRNRINNIYSGLYQKLGQVETLFISKFKDLRQKSNVTKDTTLTLEYKKLSEDCNQSIGWLLRTKAKGSNEELKAAIAKSNKSFKLIKKAEAELDNKEEINQHKIQPQFNQEPIPESTIDLETPETFETPKLSREKKQRKRRYLNYDPSDAGLHKRTGYLGIIGILLLLAFIQLFGFINIIDLIITILKWSFGG